MFPVAGFKKYSIYYFMLTPVIGDFCQKTIPLFNTKMTRAEGKIKTKKPPNLLTDSY